MGFQSFQRFWFRGGFLDSFMLIPLRRWYPLWVCFALWFGGCCHSKNLFSFGLLGSRSSLRLPELHRRRQEAKPIYPRSRCPSCLATGGCGWGVVGGVLRTSGRCLLTASRFYLSRKRALEEQSWSSCLQR